MRHTLVDTSVLVEYLKGNERAERLLSELFREENILYINSVVFSEVVYVMMGHYSGRAPRSLKRKPDKLPGELKLVFSALSKYGFVETTRRTTEIARELIEKYALLPNDAMILATCIEHGFSLATMDDEFKGSSRKGEG
ncbi:type II toxin-antitoxin system VapC family toxin [Thermococcus peptonophilus]|uniref:type II toxin-antitoxin system VapC family toxin n=1 Tax=Thermococcus peptonophilus TaxID=53952 RepID=UPI000A855F2D|nr:type II toxin-antitoxin system VapC family toxin [Thermococcus peptonophilus]